MGSVSDGIAGGVGASSQLQADHTEQTSEGGDRNSDDKATLDPRYLRGRQPDRKSDLPAAQSSRHTRPPDLDSEPAPNSTAR